MSVAKATQDAFDASMAVAQSALSANQQVIPGAVPKMAPALMASLVSVAKLKAHPLSVRVYGEPTASAELLRSIKEIGVVQPIVIDDSNSILAGTSRHYAAVQAGHAEIPAVLFKGSALEGEWLVLESNRQRVKLASQLGREYIERLRLESEFAKLRMVDGGKHKGMPQMAEAVGAARDKAAAAVNLGRTTAERLAKIVVKADTGQTRARQVLAAVDAGDISITAAFDKLEPHKPTPKPADCPVCHEHFATMTSLKKHARHVHGLEGTPLNVAMGFEKVERDPRHNQKSPYIDKSPMTAARHSVNALGWTSALDIIRHLNGIADPGHLVLVGLRAVMAYATGNTTNSTGQSVSDGSGTRHFESPQEWDTVDELIASLAQVGNLLIARGAELRAVRNNCRPKFLKP
jgi:hypothetical protein